MCPLIEKYHAVEPNGKNDAVLRKLRASMKRIIISPIIVLLFLVASCGNEPPLYKMHATEFLNSKGVNDDLIVRLTNRMVISPLEAGQLAAYKNVSVLHLLASNPSTPEKILVKLANHSNFEVHTGLVSNPATPIEIVLKFRTKGKYTTVNDYISRNPNLPTKILIEMYDFGEIGKISPALNPNCPEVLLWRIYDEGNPVDHAWLATNPNLPRELILKLESSDDSVVRQYLSTNPKYKMTKEVEKTQTVDPDA